MLKDDYCFGVFNADNPQIRTSIIIYKVSEIVNETKMYADAIDSTSIRMPKKLWTNTRTISHYTKCSSRTIEELKEEFPEVFI
jgi:iron uptake system EfeUOB component EfeO/EfeM